jgi:hypothetical protein
MNENAWKTFLSEEAMPKVKDSLGFKGVQCLEFQKLILCREGSQ